MIRKKRTISRARQFAETKRGQIDRGRDRSKDRLPTTTETVTLGTTTTTRLTSEISSASNSTQRPPIVLPPPRPVAAALTHSGGERRHPSGVSTRLPQDLGVETRTSCVSYAERCLSCAYTRAPRCNARTRPCVVTITRDRRTDVRCVTSV